MRAARPSARRSWPNGSKIDQDQRNRLLAERFPLLDPVLIDSATAESVSFFSCLLDGDLSIMNFLDADFTMLNGRLASHCGIPGVARNQMRRVAPSRRLAPWRSAVAGERADGDRQWHGDIAGEARRLDHGAPAWRLAWRPATRNVPALDKTPIANPDGTLLTPRERLADHRKVISCARCHDKIDGLGVGLENYDAFGRWNDKLSLYLPRPKSRDKPFLGGARCRCARHAAGWHALRRSR